MSQSENLPEDPRDDPSAPSLGAGETEGADSFGPTDVETEESRGADRGTTDGNTSAADATSDDVENG